MPKLICCSYQEFNDLMQEKGWNDLNIPVDSAFISIIGTPDCQKYYLEEEYSHWFKSEDSGRVCNVEFDDIPGDSIVWKGHTFYGLTSDLAEKIVDFIESNLGCNFYIHCLAGVSRSQGVVRYILDVYPDLYHESDCRKDNPCITPNMDVVRKLKHVRWEKTLL